MDSERILIWNVCGLNGRARRDVLAELVAVERISLLCIQESKLSVSDQVLINNMLGPHFNYVSTPASGTRGGFFIAWLVDRWCCSHPHQAPNSLTVKVKHTASSSDLWWLTTVYGPQADQEKVAFLQELRQLRPGRVGPWLVCGDFNLIYKAADKNNDRLNRRQMGRFRRFLQDLELSELHLNGRLYTWSNEQAHPTLERIDRAFASLHWCDQFPHHRLRAISSSCSDHAPLLLHTNSCAVLHKRFMFEPIWTKFQGYQEAVAAGWLCPTPGADPFRALDIKFRSTAKSLKSWSQKHVGSIRLQLAIAREVVYQLDHAQDFRLLTAEELSLRKELKFKCLGLASLARSIARQRSRLTFLREGDANTKFFHLQACHRGRKNYIDQLTSHGSVVVEESDKAELVFSHFDAILGNYENRSTCLDFNLLNLPQVNLTPLDQCFSEEEVWNTIRALPPDKAPGPDGFSGLFYQTAWLIIKQDIMRAFHALWSLDFRSFYLINQAYMVLLRKKKNAEEVKDFRPISLIHSFSKLVTKVLAQRLSPHMDSLVLPNQSAFIKGRAIHDNFRTVKATAKLLHVRKIPSFLLKVDIAKAFDTVNWAFLIDLMQHMGFSRRWSNWVSILLSTANTRILLNSIPGRRICHARGLRQGDPLSPFLFVLTMEALNSLFRLADSRGLLSPLRLRAIRFRVFLYADDMVVFFAPTSQDIRVIHAILVTFAAASGLHTNVGKCLLTPIQCDAQQIELVQAEFPCQLGCFPFKYLGVPLSVYRLTKADLQPLADAVADRLPSWKARLMARAGRVALTKATLSAIPVHVSIAVAISPWVLKIIDKFRRAFIWTGTDSANGGQCVVAWSRVTRPVELGGLGVLDLSTLGYALRLRWEWLSRTEPDRLWVAIPGKTELQVKAMFDASVSVQVGNGGQALFWSDRWIEGSSVLQLAPDVWAAVPKRITSMRTVSEGLLNEQWIRDIQGSLSIAALSQYVRLWDRLQGFQLQQDMPDKFIWRWSPNQQYSASSAYRAFFHGQCALPGAKELSKTLAPARCKFFIWMALLERCWTSDRLKRHNLQHSGPCAFCSQCDETITHLLLTCVFPREVWFRVLRRAGFLHLTPNSEPAIADWWTSVRKKVHKTQRKGFDTLIVLVAWSLWRERNCRVFDKIATQPLQLTHRIMDEGRQWVAAGFSALSEFLQ